MEHGCKTLRTQDGDKIVFPKVRRTKRRKEIVRSYLAMKADKPTPPAVSRGSMMVMLRSLASGEQKMKQCVDYCLAVLVFENFRTLRDIIKANIDNASDRKKLLSQADAVADFLKYGYSHHVDSDQDTAHDSKRALVGRQRSVRAGMGNCGEDGIVEITNDGSRMEASRTINRSGVDTVKCETCMKPFQFQHDVEVAIGHKNDGLDIVIDDAKLKIRLFMGHTLRCQVQRLEFEDAQRELHGSPAEQLAIIRMDYKMKYEAKKYREKSSDFYGKKGMSWHGSVITYKVKNVPEASMHAANQVELRNVYLDHICRNSTEQSAYAVCSILELVCRYISVNLRTARNIIIETDNARNYNNNLLPVLAPIIFDKYGITLDRIVHNETQDGKGPADVHFATAMRHVDRYIEDNELDVVKPVDLVSAINNGEGMYGCVGELFDVDEKCDEAIVWKKALKRGESDDGLAALGRCNKICYRKRTGKELSFDVETYEYRCSEPKYWVFQQHKSESADEADAVAVNGDDEEGDNGSDSEMESDDVEEEGRRTEWRTLECNSDTESVESIELDDFDLGRNIMFKGVLTGVKIIESGYVKRATTVLKDMLCERQLCNPESDGESDAESTQDVFRRHGRSVICRRCGQSFFSVEAVKEHYVKCKVPHQSLLLVDRAVRHAHYLIHTNQLPVITEAVDNPDFQDLQVTDEVRNSVELEEKWAKRPVRGKTLGANFIAPFRPEIKDMVLAGVKDKARRMSSDMMQETLRARYHNRFDIPRVHHIGSYVTRCLVSIRREAKRATNSSRTDDKNKMPDAITKFLEQCVKENISVLPMQGVRLHMAHNNIPPSLIPEGFPSVQQIRQKVSAIKQRVKKQSEAASAEVASAGASTDLAN